MTSRNAILPFLVLLSTFACSAAASAAVATGTVSSASAAAVGSASQCHGSKLPAWTGIGSFFGPSDGSSLLGSAKTKIENAVSNIKSKVATMPEINTNSAASFESVALSAGRAMAAARELLSSEDPLLRLDPLAGAMAGDEGRNDLKIATDKAKAKMPSMIQKMLSVDEKWMASNVLSLQIHTSKILEPLLCKEGSAKSLPAELKADVRLTQMVTLGVNTDTKAHTLPLTEDVAVFEVDHPAVIERREAIIKEAQADRNMLSAKSRTPIGLNLFARGKAAGIDVVASLKQHGWKPEEPTVFLAETTLNYLSKDGAQALLDTVCRESAPGSLLMLHVVNAAGAADKAGMQFGCSDPAKELLGGAEGWKVLQYLDGFEAKNMQGRMSWMALRAFGPSTAARMKKDSYGVGFVLAQKSA